MGMKQAVTQGTDITKPKASVNWMTGAIFGFALIAVAMSVGTMLKTKASDAIGSVGEKASGIKMFQ